MVLSELRETQGTPIWLPGHKDAHLVKRERRAYAGEEEKPKALIETGLFETGAVFVFRGPSWTDDHNPEPMILVA